jgi:hypothetical protein
MRNLLSVAAAMLAVVPLASQSLVTLTDANASFAYTSYATTPTSLAGLVNFSSAGTDHAYQNWWYYSVQGDTTGTAFNTAGGQMTVLPSGDGRSATFQWGNVDNRGFAAVLEHCVYSTGTTTGVSTQAMTLTNGGANPVTMMVYCYLDCDVSATAGGDTSVATPGGIKVTDGTSLQDVYFLADAPTASESSTFATLRGNILNSGFYQPTGNVAFGPGDWTGAHAWNITLAPSASITLRALMSTAPTASNGAAGASTFGAAKAGTNGLSGWALNRPFSNSTYALTLNNGFTGSAPVVFLGTPVPSGLPVPPFGTLYVNVLATVNMPAFGAGPNFSSTLPLPIPGLVGGALSLQAFWLDPGASASLAHSDALTLQFGSY